MKKILLFAALILMTVGCGNKTGKAAGDVDSTETVVEVPDTLNNEEAVIKQVKAVYEYLANRKEGQPWLDEQFGTKEWQQTMKALEKFDEGRDDRFYSDGFDPWTQELYGGKWKPENIKANLFEDGKAMAKATMLPG